MSEIGKSDRKGKADSDNAAWTVAGKQKSLSPAAKSKIGETEGRKQDGKGKAEATKSGATAKPMPSSGSKTKIVETEGRKETGKHEGKGRAESAKESAKESTKAGATTAAKHTASPKAKMSETEIKKQNGKKSGVRQRRGWESGGKAGPAGRLRAQELWLVELTVAACRPVSLSTRSPDRMQNRKQTLARR